MRQKFKNEGRLAERVDIEQALDAMYGPLHFLLMVRHSKPTSAYAESLAGMLVHGLAPRTEADVASKSRGSIRDVRSEPQIGRL